MLAASEVGGVGKIGLSEGPANSLVRESLQPRNVPRNFFFFFFLRTRQRGTLLFAQAARVRLHFGSWSLSQ